MLQDEIHHEMDTARADFFWHGPRLKKKYHMVKWDTLMTPKEAGGLGFTSTKTMNKCLLAKWIYKLERGDDNTCINLLRKKHLGEKGFFSCKFRGGSQFWKSLHEAKESCKRGIKHVVNNGKKTSFWSDVWIGNCPLRITFPNIFEICHQQCWSVSQVLGEGELNLTFRRNFGAREELAWESLLELMEQFSRMPLIRLDGCWKAMVIFPRHLYIESSCFQE